MILEIAILLLAIPIGFLIAYLCHDELIQGRIWFRLLTLLAFITGIYFYRSQPPISWTSAFIIIVALISLYKSHDNKWTKREV